MPPAFELPYVDILAKVDLWRSQKAHDCHCSQLLYRSTVSKAMLDSEALR